MAQGFECRLGGCTVARIGWTRSHAGIKAVCREVVEGRGLVRAALEFVEELSGKHGFSRMWLNVNKNNPSVKTHEKIGFRKIGVMVKDIGDRFMMDDFKMEKNLL